MNILKKFLTPFRGRSKSFGIYLMRWQCSTPIFIVIGLLLAQLPYWSIIIISNIIGATIFFPIDWYIMRKGDK